MAESSQSPSYETRSPVSPWALSSLDSDPLFFKGTSPEECEGFVATIRRRAFDQGRHGDDEWIAALASTYFVGDAFYWYEELGKDVQNDWSQLRPALVARFGRRNSISTIAPSSYMMQAPTWSITVPTPAAAPPTTISRHSVRKGHLKVLDSNGTLRGYIPKSGGRFGEGVYDELCTSSKDALKISFTVSSVRDEPFEIEIIDAPKLPQGGDKLVIAWPYLNYTEWMKDVGYHASCCSLSAASKGHWAMAWRVWRISQDGVLRVEYPKPDGSFETLRSSVHQSLNCMWWLKSSRPDTNEYFPARIVIEDAV